MTGRNLVWGKKYGGRERISRNIAIRRLRRRFRRAEKVSTWKSATGYQKIDATNIGSLPTTRRDGASCDRPGSEQGLGAYRAAKKRQRKRLEKNRCKTSEKSDKYASYRIITFPVVHHCRNSVPSVYAPPKPVSFDSRAFIARFVFPLANNSQMHKTYLCIDDSE